MTDRQKSCPHRQFRFKLTKNGMRRTCTRCHLSITEAPPGLFGDPVDKHMANSSASIRKRNNRYGKKNKGQEKNIDSLDSISITGDVG